MSRLPELPEKPDPTKWANSTIAQLGYQAALVAYYESRLRVAVETLQKMSRDDKPRPSAGWMFQWAHDALTAIGPLPDKGDVS